MNPPPYLSIKTLGLCTGGAAALYAGTYLGATNSISIVGFHPDTRKQVKKDWNGLTGQEFDNLPYERLISSATKIAAVYGAENQADYQGALSLVKAFPSCNPIKVNGVKGHNLFISLFAMGTLQSFLNRFVLEMN